ncbi:unnamed protein product [Allacma fusca]|uniref:Uncharacterized protein n=1 Tax=Allacma fusca TaxID=39272 RepID=A0A8J2PDX0_9HEXA|nr:unnamed protein product [Allacma fusca]
MFLTLLSEYVKKLWGFFKSIFTVNQELLDLPAFGSPADAQENLNLVAAPDEVFADAMDNPPWIAGQVVSRIESRMG